jgi:cephalosporin hydroxylase
MKEIRELLFGEGYDPYDKLKLLPLDMQGWNSQASIFGRIIEELKPKLIVEVGTWKGASAIHMAKECLKYTDDFEIVCIDTWLGSVEHWSGVSQELPRNDFINGRPNLYNQFL